MADIIEIASYLNKTFVAYNNKPWIQFIQEDISGGSFDGFTWLTSLCNTYSIDVNDIVDGYSPWQLLAYALLTEVYTTPKSGCWITDVKLIVSGVLTSTPSAPLDKNQQNNIKR